MRYKDYYRTLGLTRGASDDEIKRAYRRLARRYHPDVSKERNAEERFKEVSEAYETLRDREKRAAYDELGRFGAGQEFRPPPDWYKRHHAADEGVDLSDIFATFGGARARGGFGSRGAGLRGVDQEVTVHLSLEQAARGTEMEVQPGKRESRFLRAARTIRARIPAGVTDGQKLRLRGKGGAGLNGGLPGDLFLNITLEPHPLFRVDGHDLSIEVPLAPWEAALGAQVEVPTLGGRVMLRIPAGSRAGQKLRLTGKGLPRPHGNPGNLYAVLSVAVPETLSAQERKLYEELRAHTKFNPRAHFVK